MNHAPGGTINPRRPVAADATALIFLPLSIRESLRKLDADMDKIVSIKVYLTDLAPYAEFSKVRGEVFPHNPPTSSAVQVAGLLLGARIEIDAVALVAKG